MSNIRIKYTAKTPDEQAIGLRGKPPLAKGEAMEFIYSTPQMISFWNWGVKYPIGILFFDEQENLFQKEHLQADQMDLVFSRLPVSVVLEIPKKDLQKYNLGQTLNDIKYGKRKDSDDKSNSNERVAGLRVPEDQDLDLFSASRRGIPGAT